MAGKHRGGREGADPSHWSADGGWADVTPQGKANEFDRQYEHFQRTGGDSGGNSGGSGGSGGGGCALIGALIGGAAGIGLAYAKSRGIA
jgi:hypothetical protein